MPYLIYKIDGEQYAYLTAFDAYREARDHVRRLRAEHTAQNLPEDHVNFRLIFAADQAEAITLLQEKRDAPILKEWEK